MASGKKAVDAIIAETKRRKAIWQQMEKVAKTALRKVDQQAKQRGIRDNKWLDNRTVVTYMTGTRVRAIYIKPSGKILDEDASMHRAYEGYADLTKQDPVNFATAVAEELMARLNAYKPKSK